MTPADCRRRAMDFLARREHSRWELRHKLAAAGATGDLADETLDALEDEGLLSDSRFVESFVAARARKGQGPVRIYQELERRGVNELLIEDGIDEADIDWYELAAEVRAKKFGKTVPPDFPSRAKQMRFLEYRGFDSDQIQAAIRGGATA
ncbi:regulatory protein RecX [Lentisalinibacter orientalis]|uniref:regulatory protein RecX n=1 Tax=Lentisalinibacter orientalis TaxID=2992241 RepID=UPI0038709128